MKTDKCKWLIFPMHDWEVLEASGPLKLQHRALQRTGYLMVDGDLPIYKKRICLRCGKYEDTITPYIEEFLRENADLVLRQEKAKQMLKNKELKA